MKTVGQAILAVVVLLAVFAGGCGDDSCPTESPEVTAVADCTAPAGQTVNYPIQLCPTCNQVLRSCDVQIAGGTIFLNPVVEACSSSTSCPPGCNLGPTTCAVPVPSSGGPTFIVSAFDAAHPNTPQEGILTIGGSFSCLPL